MKLTRCPNDAHCRPQSSGPRVGTRWGILALEVRGWAGSSGSDPSSCFLLPRQWGGTLGSGREHGWTGHRDGAFSG